MRPIFRSAMFGFHKEDVADFVAKQSHQHETRTAELNRRIEELNREIEEEREAVADQLAELVNLRSFRDQEDVIFSELLGSATPLKEKADRLFLLLDEETLLVTTLDQNVQKLQKKVADAENFRKKASRFDQLASVLGEIVSGKAPDKKAESEIITETVSQIDTGALSKCIASQKEAVTALQKSVDEIINRLSELCNK